MRGVEWQIQHEVKPRYLLWDHISNTIFYCATWFDWYIVLCGRTQCNLCACLHPSYELNEFGKRYNNAGRMYCLSFFIAKIWEMVDMEKFYDPNFDFLCGFHNQYPNILACKWNACFMGHYTNTSWFSPPTTEELTVAAKGVIPNNTVFNTY